MASQIPGFEVTVPAGTLRTAPIDFPLVFHIGNVEGFEIYVPPGPSGFVGFQLVYSGEPVIPYRGTAFVKADNDTIRWSLTDFPTGGDWALRAYNEDVFDHELNIRVMVSDIGRDTPSVVVMVPIEQPEQVAPVDEQAPEVEPLSDVGVT